MYRVYESSHPTHLVAKEEREARYLALSKLKVGTPLDYMLLLVIKYLRWCIYICCVLMALHRPGGTSIQRFYPQIGSR